jgi:hypothetical protein
LYNNTPVDGVINAPRVQAGFQLRGTALVTQIVTYHWNYGRGAFPGTLTIRSNQNGQQFGPFRAQGTPGQGGAPNVNWIANVSLILPAGNYTVYDSDLSTWSQNPRSNGAGFLIVRGTYVGGGATGGGGNGSGGNGGGGNGGGSGSGSGGRAAVIPPPCHRTTNALVELAQPGCSGTIGTTIRLVVLQPLPGPLSGFVFKPGSIGQNLGLRVPSPVFSVTLPNAAALLVSGNGVTPGSVYQFQAPAQLCTPGSRAQWTWDLWLMWPGGRLQGDVDAFTIAC